MSLFSAIVKSFVKNVGNFASGFVGVPIAGDIVVDAWDNWQKETDERQRKGELETYARQRMDAAVAEALAAVRQEAPQLPPEKREAIVQYLSQVPASIRRSLRRPADDTGTTVPAGLSLRSATDMLSFLPPKLPRFKPGDRPLLHGDLELVELLGQGGFGEVWKARHLDRPMLPPVALKFCLDTAAARSLERERDLLDRVANAGKHHGIVQLLYTHLRANPPCLEYECVEGGDLTGVLAELHANGLPTPELVAKIVLNLARIVGFAHGQSPPIVHRDLKPANILVRRREGKLSFKIADFGIGGLAAKEAIRKLNNGLSRVSERQHDTMLGAYTPLYASLEQMRGDPPDPRDDVHALGIIWFQMQTGVLALMAMPNDWREDLAEAKMPPALVDLLAACIGKQARRPTDANDLANRLAAALPSSPAARSSRAAEETVGAVTAVPVSYTVAQVGISMRLIPAGRFLMGSPADEEGHDKDETLHKVVLTKPYYLAAHPVTRGQFRRFVEAEQYATEAERGDGAYGWAGSEWKKDVKFNWKNPGFKQEDEHPVVCVSHNDAVAYCEWLSRLTGETYGLPTEAQWEYACRGRARSSGGVEITTEPYHFGKAITPKYANFTDSKINGTTKVGSYPANGFGLCDMHGNVWEWCADWYGEYATSESDNTDPQGASSGTVRVFRGGCWDSAGQSCRAAYRNRLAPSNRYYYLGFRVSRVPSGA